MALCICPKVINGFAIFDQQQHGHKENLCNQQRPHSLLNENLFCIKCSGVVMGFQSFLVREACVGVLVGGAGFLSLECSEVSSNEL